MELEGSVIRPPSEADSILLQVTLGCSHNRCAFCGAYPGKRFCIRTEKEVERLIASAAETYRRTRRVFLCDGDALTMPQNRLEHALSCIREHLPQVTRVSAYGNGRGLKNKSVQDLQRLRELGLHMVYMGLESGDEAVLERMNKGCTVADMVREGQKVIQAGLKLNVTVLNGLAGPQGAGAHARATADALNEMKPTQIAALTLMLVPGTPLHSLWEKGDFTLMSGPEMLAELRDMFAGLRLEKGLFLANHASNYLPIRARLPRDRAATLRALDQALQGRVAIRPEGLRGL